MSNSHYWLGKEKRKETAKKHVLLMQEKYKDEIITSAQNTRVYDGDDKDLKPKLAEYSYLTPNDENSTFDGLLTPMDTVSAAFKHGNDTTAILNFASFNVPGGMFLQGSKAQEECLCHESTLYNVLEAQSTYYAQNNKNQKRNLYCNRALYLPDIVFEHDNEVKKINVISCAAPNFSAARNYCNVTQKENEMYLKSRIRFVLAIAAEQSISTLILGAFGCGVFGQNAEAVARIFYESLAEIQWKPRVKAVFAIPKREDGNYESFKRVFKNL